MSNPVNRHEPRPKVSLVVATIGRSVELRRLLESLLRQESDRFEVIVVDQSRTGRVIKELVLEFATTISITYLRDRATGLSRARNLGISLSRGTILGFPDDDCWYGPNVIADVINWFVRSPGTGVLTGIYTEPGVVNSNFATAAGPLSIWNVFDRACSVGMFLNCRSIGGCQIVFDERIGAGTKWPAGEEIDLILRLLRCGVPGKFDPGLVVYHEIKRDKSHSKENYIVMSQVFWYVIGKNYPVFLGLIRIARGIAGVVIKRTPFGVCAAMSAIFDGIRAGARERASIPRRR